MKNNTAYKILAPAGSAAQLTMAVNNGCNAVYLGLDKFNARMKAPNFTLENIKEWIDYCHFFGVKVYIALNTSIKNDEFDDAVNLLNSVYKFNADGVILTDIALIKMASKLPKPFDIVASTQLNIHDAYGAKFIKDCGATTVVCARESSIDEIKEIIEVGIEAECFIHGATCVCQSGQCLLSSLSGGNSGNRGLCAQPCRKLYSCDNGKTYGYLLSAKDLCGIDIIKELAEVGVSTFKIEGRNRRPEYAGLCSRIYKEQITGKTLINSRKSYRILAEMFNRAMGELSYLRGQNNDIIFVHSQNHTGVLAGRIKGGRVQCETPLNKGDGLKVFDRIGREVCGGVVLEDGDKYVSCSFSGKVQDGMTVNRTTSVKLCEKVADAVRLVPVRVSFYAHSGCFAKIKIETYDGASAEVLSDYFVEKSIKQSTSADEITKQLQKIGNISYTISDIEIDIDEIFLAKSQINALRRAAFDELTKTIVNNYNSRFLNRKAVSISKRDIADKSDMPNCTVICKTDEEVSEAVGKAEYLIFKPKIIDKSVLDKVNGNIYFLDLPSFSDNGYLEKLLCNYKCGIVCHNVGHIQLARKLGLPYIVGSGMNIYNDYIANEFSDSETFVYSVELTLKEIEQFKNRSGYVFVDGNLTLMKLVHCPYKVAYRSDCKNCKADRPLVYIDDMGNDFNIIRRKDGRCTFDLINGRKLSVVNKIDGSGRYLIDYDQNVLSHYTKLNGGINDGYVEVKKYTKGRLFDKVN